MDDEGGLTVEIERAWAGFRRRLADRLVAIDDDEVVLVEVTTGLGAEDLDGCEPHVRFSGRGERGIRVEVPGNHLLDQRSTIDAGGEAILVGAGFTLPDGDGELHAHLDAEHRDADRLAVGCVEVLRGVWGVVHPAFLSADGLESDVVVPDQVLAAAPVEDETTLPTSHDELVRLVDAALLDLTDEVEHDADGDVAFGAGMSVVFVRVCEDRPAVELFAELVMDPSHPERLPVELDILNRTHDFAKFYVAGPAVRMSYLLVAWPFNARQLLTVLRRMLGEVDEVAEALAQRVEDGASSRSRWPSTTTGPSPSTPPRDTPGCSRCWSCCTWGRSRRRRWGRSSSTTDARSSPT